MLSRLHTKKLSALITLTAIALAASSAQAKYGWKALKARSLQVGRKAQSYLHQRRLKIAPRLTAPNFQMFLSSLLGDYKRNAPLSSYSIYKATKVLDQRKLPRNPMHGNLTTNAPETKSSEAWVVLLNRKGELLHDLAVYDPMNSFELRREFRGLPKERISLSGLGSPTELAQGASGLLMFIKSSNLRGKRLPTPEMITRANLDLSGQTARLLHWKVGWFFNRYSHDYTVQLQKLGTFHLR